MPIETKQIEELVEVITREVLLAVAEHEQTGPNPGDRCVVDIANGMQVRMCFNNAGQVVSAGAERLTSTVGIIPDPSLAGIIDHTLLKPDATPDKIAQLCFEAKKYHFASVCVNPTHVRLCADLLRGSDVKVCTVIGFPLGASETQVKVFEAQTAIEHGATEIDMVINIGALKAGDHDVVARDIRAVVETGHNRGALVKVIIETALLTDEEKVVACLLAKEAGADFVKTSTGFSGGGATVHDVELMRKTVGPDIGVKASGGIHTLQDAENMVKAGATRIGASAGVKIVRGDADGAAKAAAAAPASPAKTY